MPEIELRWDNPEPHSVRLEVSSEMLMGLFTGVGECKTKIGALETKYSEGFASVNDRIETLWRVIIAGFVTSIGTLGTLIALFNSVS